MTVYLWPKNKKTSLNRRLKSTPPHNGHRRSVPDVHYYYYY